MWKSTCRYTPSGSFTWTWPPSSGRKLLTVLSREVGDDHNLVFLYWYESPYKDQYYCQYAREFFTYHLGNEATRAELRTIYDSFVEIVRPALDGTTRQSSPN